MPLFRCRVLGENFPTIENGRRRLIGFYTTRFVEAADAAEAELAVQAELKSDEWLQGLKKLREDGDPDAMIFFEEIVEVSPAADRRPGTGFTFFPMEEGSANRSESECKT